MDVKTALANRQSIRAFLNKPVSKDNIEKILAQAKCAPSGVNTQPWQVHVLSGANKQNLQEKMEHAFRAGTKGKMDYQYYPLEWSGAYKDRRKECGLLMYNTLDIQREDKERQLDQWAANYRAFDAPVMLLFTIDGIMEKGSYLDYGMFIQSVMLAAVGEGLATCPQAALGEYPDIVRTELNLSDSQHVVCGMALGYADPKHLINSYRTSRVSVTEIARFYD